MRFNYNWFHARALCAFIAVACWLTARSEAQTTPPTIISASYGPFGLRIAPGQILTLIVRGIKAGEGQLSIQAPAGTPLPNELAGVSATLGTQGTTRLRMSVLRIDNLLLPVGFEGDIRAITVQVPYEAEALRGSTPSRVIETYVAVSEGAGTPVWTRVFVTSYSAHLLSNCDYAVRANPCTYFGPAITHADGSFVTGDRPAQPGEVIVIYALGLGLTTPPVPTGAAAPSPAPATVERFGVRFSVLGTSETDLNVLSVRDAQSEFSGLVSGLVGLYQINVRVPAALGRLSEGARCGSISGSANATRVGLRAGRGNSFASNQIEICVGNSPEIP